MTSRRRDGIIGWLASPFEEVRLPGGVMTASATKTSEVMLERIDAMLRELQALREAVLSLQDQPEPLSGSMAGSLTTQLLGALGQAAPEELDDTTDLYAELFER